jgi:hypothetical protein
MSKYCLFLIVIYYLTGGNNSMSRFCKFGKLHVTKGNGDKLLDIRFCCKVLNLLSNKVE